MGKEKMYYEEVGYDFDPPFYRAEDKPVVTNGDKIRSMSDEELTSFLWNRDMDIVEKASKAVGFTFRVDEEQCLSNVLNWLKEEAE